MRITLVSGADGAAFAHDLTTHLDAGDELTVVVPVVRDQWATGLKVSPDLDALLDGSAGATTHAVADELHAVGYSPAWHRPSDREVAGQLIRTELLGAGYTLTAATTATATRRDLPFRVLPMSDDRAELHAVVEGPDGPHAVHVAEVLADPAAHDVQELLLVAGAWAVSAEARDAVESADVVVLGPSSRTLAIDPVLRTPGLAEALGSSPVLVVEHADTAPGSLVRAAGLPEADPVGAEAVASDAAVVVARARALVGVA